MVLMEHVSKKTPKVMQKCSLPVTGVKCVSRLATDMGFFKINKKGFTLIDIA